MLLNQLLIQIRSLSLVTHILLLPVKIPAIVMIFYEKIFEIVKFDILESVLRLDKILALIFELDGTPISQDASDLGYESRYIIINFGAIMVYCTILAILCLFFYTMKRTNKRR